jgi:succinate dehydrogenase / fumarate reductase, flavoprotein subunit
VPTCHYMMGGIPTNKYGQVIHAKENQTSDVVEGLYAVGECACVSVHGSNRLGGNSLLDLVVFGRAAGIHLNECLDQGIENKIVNNDHIEAAMLRVQRWDHSSGKESVAKIREELKKTMQNDFSVFRTKKVMTEGLDKLKALRERLKHATLNDKSKIFNTARVEALELDNLMAVAIATAYSAITREESRGAHSREDFPQRDDKNWLKHLLYFPDDKMGTRSVNMMPETVPPFEPKERVY